jgi:4-hydroxythreonine-4-phosphate dehydrogenase
MTDSQPIIGVTMGDPAGIGPEVIVKAYHQLLGSGRPIVIGDGDVLVEAIGVCDSNLAVDRVEGVNETQFDPDTIPVLDLDNVGALVRGEVREEYGAASLEYIERAIELAQAGEIDGITTTPINKQATKMAGSTYAGHTGMLADRTNTTEYAMMLIESDLRVTHVSTHVPLPEACKQVTISNVHSTIQLTVEALSDLGIESPTIGVAGLNPHASDGGLLGDTEAAEIEPAVERACEEGIDAVGPESPDTVYVRAAQGEFDCVVSMYHDQGHIPIKMLGFSSGEAVSGVNVTIGLPIIRTSVDHGTAFDIAGTGIASERSLLDAFGIAIDMARSRVAE